MCFDLKHVKFIKRINSSGDNIAEDEVGLGIAF
jgi:hypothetical protein